jgi:hypothetical protein
MTNLAEKPSSSDTKSEVEDKSDPEAFKTFVFMVLVEESPLPRDAKQLAIAYIRHASSTNKRGNRAGSGYYGQARLAAAQSISVRALRKRLIKLDDLCAAGLSPIKITRTFRARTGEGKRGGRGADLFQIERDDRYLGHEAARVAMADRRGTRVPLGFKTEPEPECRFARTEEEPGYRKAPDRSGTPVPMICVEESAEQILSTENKETAQPSDGAPRAVGADPAAAEREAPRALYLDDFGPEPIDWDNVSTWKPEEFCLEYLSDHPSAGDDDASYEEYVRLAGIHGVNVGSRRHYNKAVAEVIAWDEKSSKTAEPAADDAA